MARKFFWKVWLRPNPLTPDIENDYVAEISTVGNTLRNEDIAQQIVKGRSELRYETILSILNERDTVVLDTLLGGSSVQDKNVYLAPRISGRWIGSDPVFDPNQNKIKIDAHPTAELRKALEEVGVELLGKKADGGAVIGLVKDVQTDEISGIVTPGGDIIITGKKIRIAPTDDPNIGVFFIRSNGTVEGLDYPIIENNPRKIVCRVPTAIPSGTYTLKIVTHYSNGSQLLNDPRTIIYDVPIIIPRKQAQS
jgi:hypothetical protein